MSEKELRESAEDLSYRDRVVQTWDPGLPAPPTGFPDSLSFQLTVKEAEYLQDRLLATHPDCLFAHLVQNRLSDKARDIWEHPDFGAFPPQHKELISYARVFSQVMHGAALLYNMLLALADDREELAEEYHMALNAWQEGLAVAEVASWDLQQLWALITEQGHRIPFKTREFVQQWVALAGSGVGSLADRAEARVLVEQRETFLKKARSRFRNRQLLGQWNGASGLSPLSYRWDTARVFLDDLCEGLGGGRHV